MNRKKVVFCSDNQILKENISTLWVNKSSNTDFLFLFNFTEIIKHLQDINSKNPNLIIWDVSLDNQLAISCIQLLKTSRFKYIPLIILIKENHFSSVSKFYAVYANCIIKIRDEINLAAYVVDQMLTFWLNKVMLPKINDTQLNYLAND